MTHCCRHATSPTSTQLIRLGGPNFAQLPVNRSVASVTNNQRDGYHQSQIHAGQSSSFKNTVGGGCPAIDGEFPEVFAHYQQKVEGDKIRERAESFKDFYSQSTLFWNSMSDVEQEHIIAAFRFELGKVTVTDIRRRVVDQLDHVDHILAGRVADGGGVPAPENEVPPNHGRGSPALSQLSTAMNTIASRRVAVLVADGVDGVGVRRLVEALPDPAAVVALLAPADGTVRDANGDELPVDRAINTMASVLYDAIAGQRPDAVR